MVVATEGGHLASAAANEGEACQPWCSHQAAVRTDKPDRDKHQEEGHLEDLDGGVAEVVAEVEAVVAAAGEGVPESYLARLEGTCVYEYHGEEEQGVFQHEVA